jgi:hypothetical protein
MGKVIVDKLPDLALHMENFDQSDESLTNSVLASNMVSLRTCRSDQHAIDRFQQLLSSSRWLETLELIAHPFCRLWDHFSKTRPDQEAISRSF